MAFVPLVPVTLNVSMFQGLDQEFTAPVVAGPTGTPINLSTWDSFVCSALPLTPGPVQAPVAFGTAAGAAAGALTLTTAPTDLSTGSPGTAKLIIKGKPTSGDDWQVVASGVLNLAQGN